MPIRPEFREFYGKHWRTVVRPWILQRAQNKCEACGVPNHQIVLRAAGWWTPGDHNAASFMNLRDRMHVPVSLPWKHAVVPYSTGAIKIAGRQIEQTVCFPQVICHWVPIVLTVAHLNHIAGDDRDENLRALCQWCHLDYDKNHHAETRGKRKDASRPLLAAIGKGASA